MNDTKLNDAYNTVVRSRADGGYEIDMTYPADQSATGKPHRVRYIYHPGHTDKNGLYSLRCVSEIDLTPIVPSRLEKLTG